MYIVNKSPLSLNFSSFDVSPVISRPDPIRLRSLRQESRDFLVAVLRRLCASRNRSNGEPGSCEYLTIRENPLHGPNNRIEGNQLRVIDRREVPNHRRGYANRPRKKKTGREITWGGKKSRNQSQQALITRDGVE